MSIKTRAKLLLTALCAVAAAGIVHGVTAHHEPARSTVPLVTMHDTCQAEDSPCWRSPQGRHVEGQGGHYACADAALPCYDEWVAV